MELIRRLLAAALGRPTGRGPAPDRHGHAPDIEITLAELEQVGRFEIAVILDADWRTTTNRLLDRIDRKASP